MLLTVQMAADQTHRSTHAAVLDAFSSSPAGIFSLLGLLGTVLGLIVMTTGIWRVGPGPRWVAPALAAFILLEFVGAAVSPIAAVVAGALYVAAFVTLAHTVRRSPITAWDVVTESHVSQWGPEVLPRGSAPASLVVSSRASLCCSILRMPPNRRPDERGCAPLTGGGRGGAR